MNEGQDWIYSDKVKDHFMKPRNFLFGDESQFDFDAVGIVGNPICGDQMKMYIKVKDDKIEDVRWKTYGCASAIASTSALSELAKGKTLDEATQIPVTETKEFLKAKKEAARTAPEQIKKDLKEGQNEVWWILLGSNQ